MTQGLRETVSITTRNQNHCELATCAAGEAIGFSPALGVSVSVTAVQGVSVDVSLGVWAVLGISAALVLSVAISPVLGVDLSVFAALGISLGVSLGSP
ncbi:hypothetical protein PPTG_19670 [Phytophthora nicotianae INRA-310]|uniref:Uncharacterized protein n=1 Tax=Phytophthora nicotianae (strain INRA-310) TaxID=761204 RepID=W2PDP9_PHYN3|nr:hypothetical protein PPTG_19670 [Phytophthora nicotianae INRA-310]ETM98308.1 hypothetical protein PPTG_19670 [Phytophthora nicotianae INRA-310]